jgi:hypothetical protein
VACRASIAERDHAIASPAGRQDLLLRQLDEIRASLTRFSRRSGIGVKGSGAVAWVTN